jgi:hypothetical protein
MENTNRNRNLQVLLFALFYVLLIIFFGRNSFIRPVACTALYKEYLVGTFVVVALLVEQLLLIPKLYFRNRFQWFWLLSAVLILLLTAGEMTLVLPNIKRSIYSTSMPGSKMIMTFSLLVLFRNLGLFSFMFFVTVLWRELSIARKKALALKAQIQYIDVRNLQNEIVFIKIQDILYCEQDQNMANIFMISGEKYYRFDSMRNMEELLGDDLFLRISRCHLVNMYYVDAYTGQSVSIGELERGKSLVLPVSSVRKDIVVEKVGQLGVDMREAENEEDFSDLSGAFDGASLESIFAKHKKLKEIYQYIESHPSCKVFQIVSGTGFAKGSVERYIKKLKDLNCVEYQGNWKTGGYTTNNPSL